MQRIRTTLGTLALAAVASTITAGTAAAESLSGGSLSGRENGGRGGSSLGHGTLGGNAANNVGPRSYNGDTTGAHHIDPLGYHHSDSNPVLRNEHLANRRDRLAAPQPGASRSMSNDSSRSTWTAVPNEDGTGWAVCKPQAISC